MKLQSLFFKLQEIVQFGVDMDLRTMKIMLDLIKDALSPTEFEKHGSHINLIKSYTNYQESLKKSVKRVLKPKVKPDIKRKIKP